MAAEAKDFPEAKDEGKDGSDDESSDREYDIVADAKISSPSSRKGLAIDIGAALEAAAERQSLGAKLEMTEEERIVAAASQPVRCLFDLPDGSQVEYEFQMGQSVEVLKAFVREETGMEIHQQSLFLEGGAGPLLDPLSLLDYPQINPREEVLIRVEGEMDGDCGGAKK